ncbi:unnamed protein product [Calypogeia fissa]
MAAQIRASREFIVVFPSMNRSVPSDCVYEDRNKGGSLQSVQGLRTFSLVNVRGWPIAMFIDGACRGNGQAGARAAYGVYTAQNSPFNRSGVLPNWASHTSQAAEIYAAREAVLLILQDPERERWKDGVVLITDSDYLFKSMTRNVGNWISNGFLDANGRPLVNGTAMSQLDTNIRSLEDGH